MNKIQRLHLYEKARRFKLIQLVSTTEENVLELRKNFEKLSERTIYWRNVANGLFQRNITLLNDKMENQKRVRELSARASQLESDAISDTGGSTSPVPPVNEVPAKKQPAKNDEKRPSRSGFAAPTHSSRQSSPRVDYFKELRSNAAKGDDVPKKPPRKNRDESLPEDPLEAAITTYSRRIQLLSPHLPTESGARTTGGMFTFSQGPRYFSGTATSAPMTPSRSMSPAMAGGNKANFPSTQPPSSARHGKSGRSHGFKAGNTGPRRPHSTRSRSAAAERRFSPHEPRASGRPLGRHDYFTAFDDPRFYHNTLSHSLAEMGGYTRFESPDTSKMSRIGKDIYFDAMAPMKLPAVDDSVTRDAGPATVR